MNNSSAHNYGSFPEDKYASNEALHLPPVPVQRTQEEMVLAMPHVDFTPESVNRHHEALQEARVHMLLADTERVMNMTGLQSPFPRNDNHN